MYRRLAAAFHAQNPEVSVIVKIGDTAEITNLVLESVLDMGFVGSRPSESRIDSDPYGVDELVVVVNNDHPWADKRAVTLEELGTQPILIRELGSGTRETFEDALRANGKTLDQLQIVAELGSSEAIKQGILAGLGAGIISVIAVEEAVRVGTLVSVPIDKLKHKRDFHRIWHRQRDPSPLARLFTRFLAEHKLAGANVAAAPASSGSGRRKGVPKS
jgi:DNA-binding transcriptional LysR family regulator